MRGIFFRIWMTGTLEKSPQKPPFFPPCGSLIHSWLFYHHPFGKESLKSQSSVCDFCCEVLNYYGHFGEITPPKKSFLLAEPGGEPAQSFLAIHVHVVLPIWWGIVLFLKISIPPFFAPCGSLIHRLLYPLAFLERESQVFQRSVCDLPWWPIVCLSLMFRLRCNTNLKQ